MGRDHSCDICGTGGFNSEHDAAYCATLLGERIQTLEHAVYDAWKHLEGEAKVRGDQFFAQPSRAILRGQLPDYALSSHEGKPDGKD